MTSVRYGRVRLYQMLRTAHLERAHSSVPASIVFVDRRYDFDEGLAEGLDLIRAGTLRAPLILMRSKVRELEVNEPLVRSRLVRTILSVAAVRAAGRISGRRTLVAAYAIENRDPFIITSGKTGTDAIRSRLRGRADRSLSRLLSRQIDRIAFGTPGSAELYRELLGRELQDADGVMLPALPAPCGCLAAHVGAARNGIIFVGAFEDRKGIPELLESWLQVRRSRPDIPLTLIGKGKLQPQVDQFARDHPDVTVIVDPPRSTIHSALATARVLVLLSQPRPRWREQVGLPIVEALAHGCAVVTTTETGLAEWLSEHGHSVLPVDMEPDLIAGELIRASDSGANSTAILASLPEIDGRLAADTWLLTSHDSEGPGGLPYSDPSPHGASNGPAAPADRRNSVMSRLHVRLHQALDTGERRRLIRKAVERGRGRRRGQRGAQIARGAKLTGGGVYRLGRGSRIKEDARIFVADGATLTLGDGAAIGIRNIVNVAMSVTIGDRSRLSWDCQILDTDFHQVVFADGRHRPKTAAVVIGEHVLIGTGAIILKGVTIGDGAVVAAGSVVSRDVPPNTIVAGNPAKPVGTAAGWS